MKIFFNTLLVLIVFGLPFHTTIAKDKSESSFIDYINTLTAKRLAKATVNLSNKIEECKQKEHKFHLNSEDKKYLKRYPEHFFSSIILLSFKYNNDCSNATKLKFEDELLRTILAFKKLGIPSSNLDPHFLSPSPESEEQLSKIPLPLKNYLVKRMKGRFYNISQLFDYIDKYRQ